MYVSQGKFDDRKTKNMSRQKLQLLFPGGRS